MHNICTTYIHIHAHTYTQKHQIHTRYRTYGMIYVLYLVCILYVWPFLNVEYIHHTCTYMTHTGMCNLMYTAYRISCICMYLIVSALYLFSAFVSACIHSCISMYVVVFACICMYEQEYLPGDTLEGRATETDCL